MNIAVIEDNRAQNQALCALVLSMADVSVFPFLSGEKFLFSYHPGFFDLLLLDIQMPGDDGIQVAKELRRMGDDVPLVFVTAIADYVFDGYDVGAVQYLLKPVDRKKLKACIEQAKRRRQAVKKVLFSTGEGLRTVDARDILYLEARAHHTEVTTTQEAFVCTDSFGALLPGLPFDFACPHRCYCVNLAHLWQLGKQELILDSGAHIPVSRRRYAAFAEAFLQYARREL